VRHRSWGLLELPGGTEGGVKVGDVAALEVATGGDPIAALTRAAAIWSRKPQVISLAVRHDDGCPCLYGRSMFACTCEIVELEARRVA
jgi:hypothetical protein